MIKQTDFVIAMLAGLVGVVVFLVLNVR